MSDNVRRWTNAFKEEIAKMDKANKIIVYGTLWCGDCFRSHKLLQEAGIDYVDVDIDQDAEAAEKVIQINKGFRSVPTIVFPDGVILVEPSNMELVNALKKFQEAK